MTASTSEHSNTEAFPPTSAADREREVLHAENAARGRKYMRLAWAFELMAVAAGIGVAYAQAFSVPRDTHAATGTLIAVLLVFLMIAVAELAKIPLALATYSIRGPRRLLPLLGLVVVSLITFETAFNGIERQTHLMTGPVVTAEQRVTDLEAEEESLRTDAEVERSGPSSAELDAIRRAELQEAEDRAEDALTRAMRDMESPETRQLREELNALLADQNAAGEAAGQSWDAETATNMERLLLGPDVIGRTLHAQIERRQARMPTRSSAVSGAREPFDAQITELQQRIEASIAEPSPEATRRRDDAAAFLDQARADLHAFEVQATQQYDARREETRQAERDIAEREGKIKAIELDLIDARRALTHAAEGSQMHRWASFVFGVDPEEATKPQVKLVSAVFGTIIGIAIALGGSSIALVAQWFRSSGIRPEVVTVTETVEVEREVEKVVTEFVEKPIDRFVYVPVAPTMDVDDILDRLPPAVAADLRKQMAVDDGPNVTMYKEAA